VNLNGFPLMREANKDGEALLPLLSNTISVSACGANQLRACYEITGPDGEGFLFAHCGAKRSNVLDVHDFFATQWANKKTSQMAWLFRNKPLILLHHKVLTIF
jgi:hypothetical protein